MYVFIINPKAGNGRSSTVFSKIKKCKEYKEIESIYYFTEYAGHAEELAREISEKPDIKTVIVIGGDGTIHEVINGLCSTIPVAFIPGGSGNDFARGARIVGGSSEIFKRIVHSDSIFTYWVGNYTLDDEDTRKYANSVGFGFDAQITHTANKSRYKRIFNTLGLGTLTYVIALIQVLFHFKPMSVDIKIDQELRTLTNCWMITTTNHPYYGGGMKIIPNAKIKAETFPVLIIHDISKWKVLTLFLTVFTGKHVNFKEVEILEAAELTISSEKKAFIQIDGETKACCQATVKKQSESINIIGTKSKQIV